jgi:predicted ATP-grasp superfamily ATP-dependent carboligase
MAKKKQDKKVIALITRELFGSVCQLAKEIKKRNIYSILFVDKDSLNIAKKTRLFNKIIAVPLEKMFLPDYLSQKFGGYFNDKLPQSVICYYDMFGPALCEITKTYYKNPKQAAALMCCYSKALMRKKLKENKVCNINFFEINSAKNTEKLKSQINKYKNIKWIIKPAVGGASEMVSPALTDFSQIRKYIVFVLSNRKYFGNIGKTHKWVKGLILEEFIEGEEYSAEGIVDGNSNVKIAGIFQKQGLHFVNGIRSEGVNFSPIENKSKEKPITELVKKAITAVGLLSCVFHIEIRWDKKRNKPQIIEINPRLPGGLLSKIHQEKHGWNLAKLLIDMHLNRRKLDTPKIRNRDIFGDLPLPLTKKGIYRGYKKPEFSFKNTDVEIIDFTEKNKFLDPSQKETYYAHAYIKSNDKKEFWKAVKDCMKIDVLVDEADKNRVNC